VGERIQLRRRLRQQRQAREAMLLDLGALVYELHRQGRRAPELLQQKAAELEVVDGEVRELEDRLAGLAPDGEPGWDEGEAQEEAVPAYHEDFDDLDEEEPDEDDEDEEFEEDELDADLDEEEPIAGELDEDELDYDESGDGDLADDDLYDDDAPADPDATVEVDALDGVPDDRETRS
jgi:hypothetical protein